MTMLLRILFCLMIVLPSWAQEKAPPKEKGSIDPSGKFVPKGKKQEQNAPVASAAEARKNLLSSLKVKELGNGKYKIGEVTIDKSAKTVTFPVKVNMVVGVVEYILVHEQGKVHESVLTTSARPTDVHLACLLLGQKSFEGHAAKWPKHAGELPAGHSVKLELTWPTNGPEKRVPLASCLLLAKGADPTAGDGRAYPDGPWFYNGSQFRRGVFVAQVEGSIVSIIGDHTALLNGMRKGHQNDDAHTPNSKLLPRKGKTVKLVISLPMTGSATRKQDKQ